MAGKALMASKSDRMPDRDSSGVPYSGSRIGACGNCGGHVMAGGGHPVPLPPKCCDCNATVQQPLVMTKAPSKAKGWIPRKRGG